MENNELKKVILATVLSGSISGVNANSASDDWAISNYNDPIRDFPILEATKVGRNGMASLNLVCRNNITVFSIEFLGNNRIVGPNKFEYRLGKGEVKSSDEIAEVWFGAGERVLISTVGRQGDIAPKLINSLIEASRKGEEEAVLSVRAITSPEITTEIFNIAGIENFLEKSDPCGWLIFNEANEGDNDEDDVVNPLGAGFEEGDSRDETIGKNAISFKYKEVNIKLIWFDRPPYKDSESMPIRSGVKPKMSLEPFKEYSLNDFLVKLLEAPPDVAFLYNDDDFLLSMT